MKKIIAIIFNTAVSVLLGILAVYWLSFLNMVPRKMQVDLPHYMYPDVMPASGMDAYHAQKARERLAKKVHSGLVDVGIIEETTKESYVPTDTDIAKDKLTPYSYAKFARSLGYSLIQQGYFTSGTEGEGDLYFSPSSNGTWYVYDTKNKKVTEASSDAAEIPCDYEDVITFFVSRDPAGKVSSDMEEILSSSEPADDLADLAKKAVVCFGPNTMKAVNFASLLQYQAAGLFLGFEDKTPFNMGKAFYLSGEDRRTINQVVYNLKYTEFFKESAKVNGNIISTVIGKEFYTYDPDSRMVGKVNFWTDDMEKGLNETKIAVLPEGYTGPPVVGLIEEKPVCVFAGNTSVQFMDLASGEIRELPELSLTDGEAFEGISFVFGKDRLVLFYTTTDEPEKIQVKEILFSSDHFK